jgi:hypothetical protein
LKNAATGRQLQCTIVTDDSPFVQDTNLTVVIQAKSSLWSHVEDIGMDITSAAATARDAAAVRPAAAARPGAPAPPPPPPAFTYSATDEFVTLPGDWKLQPNTSPTITIKMVYSPKALTNSLSDADIAAEVPIAFTSRLYPPVLQKFHFNVDTGLIVSSVRNPSFVRVQTAAAVGTQGQSGYVPAQYTTQKIEGDLTVLPALMFTIYFPARTIGPKLKPIERMPQPTFGISLTSPGSDFFVGASSEVVRKIQVVGGLHAGKINSLVTVPYDDPSSSAAPATTQRFAFGGFVGIALNLDFIKSAFGK